MLDGAALPSSCSIEGCCCCVVPGVLIVIFSLASRYIFHDYTTVNSTFDKCTTFALDDAAPISYILKRMIYLQGRLMPQYFR